MLHASLEAIVDATAQRREANLASLSSLPRPQWARLREQIVGASLEHADAVRAIEGSLFTVSLNGAAPDGAEELARMMQAGGDGDDVWFDKSFNLIVYANGRAGAHIEHGHFDAPIIIRMLTYCKALATALEAHLPAGTREAPAEASTWRLLETELRGLPAARDGALSRRGASTSCSRRTSSRCFRYERYGRKRIVKLKAPADSVFQLALQLAQLRDQRTVCATYETASTRRFFHGRTETIRSCSSQSTAWYAAAARPPPIKTPSARTVGTRHPCAPPPRPSARRRPRRPPRRRARWTTPASGCPSGRCCCTRRCRATWSSSSPAPTAAAATATCSRCGCSRRRPASQRTARRPSSRTPPSAARAPSRSPRPTSRSRAVRGARGSNHHARGGLIHSSRRPVPRPTDRRPEERRLRGLRRAGGRRLRRVLQPAGRAHLGGRRVQLGLRARCASRFCKMIEGALDDIIVLLEAAQALAAAQPLRGCERSDGLRLLR